MVDFSTLDDSEANKGLNFKFKEEKDDSNGLNFIFDPSKKANIKRDLTPGRSINPDRKK